MKSKKHWLPFILLNIIISAITVLLVLYLWNRIHPTQQLTLQYAQATADNSTQSSPVGTLPAPDNRSNQNQ